MNGLADDSYKFGAGRFRDATRPAGRNRRRTAVLWGKPLFRRRPHGPGPRAAAPASGAGKGGNGRRIRRARGAGVPRSCPAEGPGSPGKPLRYGGGRGAAAGRWTLASWWRASWERACSACPPPFPPAPPTRPSACSTRRTGGPSRAIIATLWKNAAILVDLDIMAAQPARYVIAGALDAMAKWLEIRNGSPALNKGQPAAGTDGRLLAGAIYL